MTTTDLKIDGARLMTVAVGRDLNMLELHGISSFPNDANFFHRTSYLDFDQDFFTEVMDATCDGELSLCVYLEHVVIVSIEILF